MATPNFIKDFVGFDAMQTGIVVQDFPHYVIGATYAPQITTGTGKFAGQGLSCNRAPSTTVGVGIQRQFPSTSVMINTPNTSDPANKALWQWSGWLRIDTIAATLAASPIVSLTSSGSASTAAIPLIGVLNNTSNGLNLVFPTNMSSLASLATSPTLVAIQTGLYYFISIRITSGMATSQIRASYVVSGATIVDNGTITMTATPTGTNPVNRWQQHSSTNYTYTLDDVTVQTVNGTDADWPGGFTDEVPNLPVGAGDMPVMTPRRVYLASATANGSINEWESSNSEVPNYQAATNGVDFVQATDSGQTDLYKFTVDAGATDILAVNYNASSNKYLSVNPSLKYTSAGSQVDNPGVPQKGSNRILTVVEQADTDTPWTVASFEAAEFGQISL